MFWACKYSPEGIVLIGGGWCPVMPTPCEAPKNASLASAPKNHTGRLHFPRGNAGSKTPASRKTISCQGVVVWRCFSVPCCRGASSAVACSSPATSTPPILLGSSSAAPVPAPQTSCVPLNGASLGPSLLCGGFPSAPPVSGSPPPRVTSPTGTDLVIVNNTGFPNSAVYVYAVGGGQYLKADGTLAPIGATIPPLPLAPTGPTVFPLPYMSSARRLGAGVERRRATSPTRATSCCSTSTGTSRRSLA